MPIKTHTPYIPGENVAKQILIKFKSGNLGCYIRPLGSSGIFFRSLSKMKREDGTHLRPLKQKETGMS
jgi:hypothetical protein